MGDKETTIKVHKNILSVPPLDMPKLRGLGSTFFYKMLEFKDEIAQTNATTGEKESYSLVLQKSIRVAIAMRSRGLRPKDVITICSYNHLDYLIPYYASLFLGALSANLDPAVPLSDTSYVLKQVCPKIIFAVPEAVKLMEDTIRETGINATIVVFGDTSKHVRFSEFLVPSSEEKDFVPFEVKNLKETAAIVFSSGTTGLPKGICLSHYEMLGSTYHAMPPATRGTTFLVLSNLNWILGSTWTTYIIVYGLNRIFCRQFDPDNAWDLIKENKVNMVSLIPLQFMRIFKNGRPEGADTSSLKFVLLVGFFITNEIMRHVRKCLPGTLVMNSYGQTELFGRALCFRPDIVPKDMELLLEKPTSVGKPMPGYTYKIVDPETEEILGPNQEGELRIKTEFAMNGYYNMDSSDAWDSDGFMKTGDVAYYDDELCFFIVDRIKDLIKYQVWHISPAKLEAIFRTHPAVETAVVTGIPHPVDGDNLMGLVVLKESFVGKVSLEELQKYVDDRVGEQEKMRAGVKFVKDIPATVSGKIRRRVIRQMVIEEDISETVKVGVKMYIKISKTTKFSEDARRSRFDI